MRIVPCDRSLANHMRKYLKFLTAIVITYNASNQANESSVAKWAEQRQNGEFRTLSVLRWAHNEFRFRGPFCILSISNEFVLFEWVMCVCFVPLHSVMLLLLLYEWDTMPKRNELFNYLQLWRLSSDCFRCCVPFCLVSIKDIVIEIGWNEPSSFKDPPDQSLNSKYRKKSNRWREREKKTRSEN